MAAGVAGGDDTGMKWQFRYWFLGVSEMGDYHGRRQSALTMRQPVPSIVET